MSALLTASQATSVLGIGPIGARAAPVPAWIALLRDAARTATGVPMAILLPDTVLAAETAAALLVARDLAGAAVTSPETVLGQLDRGHRVRVLPDEGVYEFDGAEAAGFWLHALDRNLDSAGRFLVPRKGGRPT